MCNTCKNMDESLQHDEQKALHLIEYMIPFHLDEILHKQNWSQKINLTNGCLFGWSTSKYWLGGYTGKLSVERLIFYILVGIWVTVYTFVKEHIECKLSIGSFIVCKSYIITVNKYWNLVNGIQV